MSKDNMKISLKLFGLYCFLQRKSILADGNTGFIENLTLSEILNSFSDSRGSIRPAIKELEQMGLISRKQVFNSDGGFEGHDYLVFSSPKQQSDINTHN